MPTTIWSPTMATGNPTIDHQHRQLFEMVNDLHQSLTDELGRETTGPILEKLSKYVVDHFAMEERFMQAASYPKFLRHKQKHDALTAQVTDLVNEWDKGTVSPSSLFRFLSDWVSHHTRGEDKELISWLNAHEHLGNWD